MHFIYGFPYLLFLFFFQIIFWIILHLVASARLPPSALRRLPDWNRSEKNHSHIVWSCRGRHPWHRHFFHHQTLVQKTGNSKDTKHKETTLTVSTFLSFSAEIHFNRIYVANGEFKECI